MSEEPARNRPFKDGCMRFVCRSVAEGLQRCALRKNKQTCKVQLLRLIFSYDNKSSTKKKEGIRSFANQFPASRIILPSFFPSVTLREGCEKEQKMNVCASLSVCMSAHWTGSRTGDELLRSRMLRDR